MKRALVVFVMLSCYVLYASEGDAAESSVMPYEDFLKLVGNDCCQRVQDILQQMPHAAQFLRQDSVLRYAISEQMVFMLCGYGADSAQRWDEETSLAGMARNPRATADAVQALITCGARVNALDGNGYSALYEAVLQGHAPAVACLLCNGADPELKKVEDLYDQENSLLEVAVGVCGTGNCPANYTAIAQMLLDHGVSARDNTGKGHLGMAALQGATAMVEVLLAGASPQAKWYASLAENPDPHFGQGIPLNDNLEDEWSALHGAVEGEQPEMVAWLLAKGARTDAVHVVKKQYLNVTLEPGERRTPYGGVMRPYKWQTPLDMAQEELLVNKTKLKNLRPGRSVDVYGRPEEISPEECDKEKSRHTDKIKKLEKIIQLLQARPASVAQESK